MITRRGFLAQAASALVVSGNVLGAGCKRAVRREDVLAAIAKNVALPDMRALRDVDLSLVRAVEALPSSLRAEDLAPARAALSASLLAWERAYVFRSGPLVQSNAFLRARFWPVRKSSLHALLLGEQVLDANHVAQLGVDVKGLYALERLFWEELPLAGREGFLFEASPERARSLAALLAKDVQTHSNEALKLLGAGGAFVESFVSAGQESVALLVTRLVETAEAIVADRLERVLGLQRNARLHPGDLPGDFSHLSSRLTCVAVRGIHAQYLGVHEDGLTVLVKQAAPAIDAHVRAALREAVRATDALDAPLEQLVLRDASKIERARDRVKALELALKVELPSALAVTLSIVAGDGD